jgi:hypothetical protein
MFESLRVKGFKALAQMLSYQVKHKQDYHMHPK